MSSTGSSPNSSPDRPGVVLIGGGGHAAVCLDVLRSAGRTVRGYLAPSPSELDLEHLGTDDELAGLLGGDEVFVALGDNRARARIVGDLLRRGVPLTTGVSAHAMVSPSVRLGRGTVVMPGAVINARSVVGDAVIVNTSASIDHDAVIGMGVHIAPGSHLAGAVTVRDLAFLGAGTIVIPGRTIGRRVVTGAGTVVVADLAAGTYVGVPARPLPGG